MGKKNQELIEKAISTDSLLNGGEMNPDQQSEFIRLVRAYSTLLPQVRFVPMDNPREDIDKMHVGEPVTESASENVDTGNQATAKFNKVTLTAEKVRSSWNITTETLQINIEKGDLEARIFESMSKRIATDLELLSIQGDNTLTGTDPIARLLKSLDGFDKRTDQAHIFDAAGAEIEKGIWSAAKDRLPKQYRNDPDLRWIVSDTLVNDWTDYLSDRGTPLGDASIGGSRTSPLGIPFLEVAQIPDDQAVEIDGASHAQVTGLRQGPFTITAGSNDKLKIDVDNAGSGTGVTVTLTAGEHEAVRICSMINQALGDEIAFDNGMGQIMLKSLTTGTGSEIDIQAIANDAYDTLGFTEAVTAGAASGGDENDGTFVLLCNPKNLIFGMLNGTRVYSEFNKDFDRIETRVYNHVCTQIENIDAVVKITNLRRRRRY